MRTTLNLDDELIKQVKTAAAESRRSMTQVIEEALREYFRPRDSAGKFTLDWTPVAGRVQPGVDIADRDALYDRLDGRE